MLERESLDLFARHYETGKVIPDELFNKMLRARNYLTATANMRQLAFGKMDLELHRRFAKEPSGELDAIISEIQDTYVAKLIRLLPVTFDASPTYFHPASVMPPPTTPTSGRRCWTPMPLPASKKEGVMSAEVGMDFRKKIF